MKNSTLPRIYKRSQINCTEMKMGYLLTIILLIQFFMSCKKEESPKKISIPIKIEAYVPAEVYATGQVAPLDAIATALINGTRVFNYLWTCTAYPTGHPPQIKNPAQATTQADNLTIGNYEFTLKVWDNLGNEATKKFPMKVLKETLAGPPKFLPLPDMTIQLPMNIVTLDGSLNRSQNPYGRQITFKWQVIEAPLNSDAVIFYNDTMATTQAIIRTKGKYLVKLDMTNEIGLTSSDSIEITMLPDPISGTEKTYEDQPWTLVGIGTVANAFIIIKEPETYRFRNEYNTAVNVWDEEKNDWLPADKYNWYVVIDELHIMSLDLNPEKFRGKKTKVRVKFL